MKNYIIPAIVLLLITTIFSCKKDDDDLATISNSQFTVTQSDWTGSNGVYTKTLGITVSSDDLVMVYYSEDEENYTALPYTADDYITVGYEITQSDLVEVSLVYYSISDSPTSESIGTNFFKVVVVKNIDNAKKRPVDWDNYEEVSELYGLD